MITIRADFSQFQRQIAGLGKQLPFTIALAVTKTAQAAKEAVRVEIGKSFERPTRWALNSVYMRPATKQAPVAQVWLKGEYPGDPFRSFMRPQIFGGTRPQKKFEYLLQRARVLPQGWVTVPGKAAKIDSYGNQSRAEIVQILSALSAFPQGGTGYSMNRTAASKKRRGAKLRDIFFSSPFLQQQAPNKGRLPWGVWERKRDGTVQCLLFFVRSARYRPRLDFFGVIDRTVARELPKQFAKAATYALRTAR